MKGFFIKRNEAEGVRRFLSSFENERYVVLGGEEKEASIFCLRHLEGRLYFPRVNRPSSGRKRKDALKK